MCPPNRILAYPAQALLKKKKKKKVLDVALPA